MLRGFERLKIIDATEAEAIIDASSQRLDEANVKDLVYLLYMMALLNIRHPTLEVRVLSSLNKVQSLCVRFKDIVSKLARSPDLTSDHLFRVIASFARFSMDAKLNVEPFFKRIPTAVTAKELEKSDLLTLIKLADGLVKLRYRNTNTAMALAEFFEKCVKRRH